MEEVEVHLQDQAGPISRAPEAVEVRRPESLLARPMEDVDPVARPARRSAISPVPSGELSSITSTSRPHAALAEGADHRLEVLALVVRGEADTDHVPYDRRRGGDVAPQRRGGRAVRPARRPARARRRAAVPRARIPARRRPDPLDAGPIAQLALDGKAKDLPGIGKTIESKIVQIVDTGEIEALTKRKERIPAGVADFLRLPALGPKTARRIWQELGITTIEDLRKAAEAQRLRSLPGLGAKTEERILKALDERYRRRSAPSSPQPPRRPRRRRGAARHPARDEVSEAGSVRRRTETVATSTSSPPPATRPP